MKEDKWDEEERRKMVAAEDTIEAEGVECGSDVRAAEPKEREERTREGSFTLRRDSRLVVH